MTLALLLPSRYRISALPTTMHPQAASTSSIFEPAYASSTTLPSTGSSYPYPNALQFHPHADGDDIFTLPHHSPQQPRKYSGTIRTLHSAMDEIDPESARRSQTLNRPPTTQRQPLPTRAMRIDVMDPKRNTLNKPYDSNDERGWSYGLCGCCRSCSTFGVFCASCWCPCCVYGLNKTRLESLEKDGIPEADGGSCCGRDTWCYGGLCLFSALGWVLQVKYFFLASRAS